MRNKRAFVSAALVACAACTAGCQKAASPAGPAAAMPPQAATQQKANALQMQEYQITHSNLPPDQKQRLLNQISAPGAK